MVWRILLAVLLVGQKLESAESYKILCLFPHVAKSHFLMAEALLKGLASKGHQVTMVSHFPQEKPIPNYKDISLVGTMEAFVNSVPIDALATGYVHTTIDFLAYMGYVTCENTLKFPAMRDLINSNEKFDLIITELFNTDCLLGYVYKSNTPFIALSTSILMPWANERFGNPDNPAYMGNHFLPHGYYMSFKERFINTLYQEGLKIWYKYMFEKPSYELAKKYFGENLPPLSEIAKNTSLLLVNTHFSLNGPRPLVPNIVEVGGIHLKPPSKPPSKNLPEEVKRFLDRGDVIYFSLGSSVRAETLSADKRDAFIKAFSALPQRVLWKWEGKQLPQKPHNVMIAEWLPQNDVLAHPNVKAFITHGGLMGTMEAAALGKPMIVIPLFGDQFHNARCYEEQGIATVLDYRNITQHSVLAALENILKNPSYAENAKRVKEAFHDRPLPPLETAIYWTEYVLRTGGAHHMRSAAVDLPWYQYLLLDVAAVLILILFTILAAMYLILRKLFSLCCGKQQKKPVKVDRRKKTS